MGSTSQGEQRFWDNYEKWKGSYFVPRDFLRVDWKSRKYRGTKRGFRNLTSVMKRSLKTLLLSKGKHPGSRTIKALHWRGLVDEDGNLTDHGKTLALTRLSLRAQCQFLDLPLETWQVGSLDSPENAVQMMLEEQGLQAYFVENTFGLFIDYVIGHATVAVARKLDKRIFTLNLPNDPELFFWVKRDLEKYLDRLDEDHCKGNRPICDPFLQTLITDRPLSRLYALFEAMYRSLTVERVRSLLRMYFANPLAYNYRGWPDLFVAQNHAPYCIEVKTTDKLHLNQLVTIPDLVKYTGLPVKVVRLSESR